jgi:hypothetical protein
MLFRISSNLFLSVSLIWEVVKTNEYEICLSDFFLVSLVSEIDVIQGSLMCIPGPLRLL